MARRSIAVVLISLMASPAFAQDLRSSVQQAVNAAVQQQETSKARRIPPGLLWTSVGLLGAGGLYLGLGAAEDADQETCVYTGSLEASCVSNRKVLLTTGAVLAGAGGVLLAIGVKKSHAPQVTFVPRGVAVQQPVPLDLGIGRLVRR